MDLSGEVPDFLVSGVDLSSNGLNLLGDFNAFLRLVGVLVLEHLEFVLAAADDAVLTLDLCLEISLQNCNALLIGLSSSLEVFDLGAQGSEVSLAQLVGLDFGPVGRDDTLPDVLADLCDLILLLVLLLDLLVLHVLSLLSLLAVLLVVAEGWGVADDVHVLGHWWVLWRVLQVVSWGRVGPDGRAGAMPEDALDRTSSVSFGVPGELILSRVVPLLSVVGSPEALRRSEVGWRWHL